MAVFFEDQTNYVGGYNGGLTLDDVFFEPNTGGQVLLGNGMQVFERGNVVFEFLQPYRSDERLAVDYEIVVYYLPHTEIQRQGFLTRLQDDASDFFEYKELQKTNVQPLCDSLSRTDQRPEICPENTGPTTGSGDLGSSGDPLVTDPNDLPELDFSGRPTRAPEITLREDLKQTFINEPVTLEVAEVFDPDGKCQFFQFAWQKPSNMQVSSVDVDPRYGDLFFIPNNVGVFTLQLRVQEACDDLGTLRSQPVYVQVVVKDKATAFTDLAEAPQYQNAILQLYHLGVVQGYPDGTMRPNAPINRAEFLKILFETLDYRIDQSVFSPRYKDVQPGEWFAPYVSQADVLGVIKGYPDGNFHPGWTVNLVEALKMAMNFSTLEILDDDIISFPDVENTDWFSRYVKTAYRNDILNTLVPGQPVKPAELLTRGKAMQIVVRTLLFPVNKINYVNEDVQRAPVEYQDFTSFIY